MAINQITIPYNSFLLGEVIDPDHANTNNAEVAYKINQLINKLNSVFVDETGLPTDFAVIKGSIVEITPIQPFVSDNIEDFLNELTARLISKVAFSGASLIGSIPITGLTGDTVETQIQSLYTLLDAIVIPDFSSYAEGLSGAMLIGSSSLPGIVGTTVQTQLLALNEALGNVSVDEVQVNAMIDTKLESFEGGSFYAEARIDDPINPEIGRIWLRTDL